MARCSVYRSSFLKDITADPVEFLMVRPRTYNMQGKLLEFKGPCFWLQLKWIYLCTSDVLDNTLANLVTFLVRYSSQRIRWRI
jgi:hypothetical protein